jgi:hypothetical protein
MVSGITSHSVQKGLFGVFDDQLALAFKQFKRVVMVEEESVSGGAKPQQSRRPQPAKPLASAAAVFQKNVFSMS